MDPKIVFVTQFPDAATAAAEMAPSGFDLQVVPAKSAEYRAAMADAEYLVGYVDMLVNEDLFKTGPNLKLGRLRRLRACPSATMAARTRSRCRNMQSCWRSPSPGN